jgi:hypothetical protein
METRNGSEKKEAVRRRLLEVSQHPREEEKVVGSGE